jgi:hypothetical protein
VIIFSLGVKIDGEFEFEGFIAPDKKFNSRSLIGLKSGIDLGLVDPLVVVFPRSIEVNKPVIESSVTLLFILCLCDFFAG